MLEQIIVDADFCIKLGNSSRYRILHDVVPIIAKRVFVHSYVLGEVQISHNAFAQLSELVTTGLVTVVNESELIPQDRAIYDMSYAQLKSVMMNPDKPSKNKGEVCSLAFAKVKGIPIFATDERDLQPIIDMQFNTGINDIQCLRIVDLAEMARKEEVEISRKMMKIIWVVAGKSRDHFDQSVWPKA